MATAAITALETLASAAAGAQVRLTVAYDTLIRTQEQANGMAAARRGRTVASDIATARREPPYRGVRHLGLAKALLEMPNTAWALSTGQISEWKGMLLAKESAALTLEQRAGMDAELADIMLTVPDKVLESRREHWRTPTTPPATSPGTAAPATNAASPSDPPPTPWSTCPRCCP